MRSPWFWLLSKIHCWLWVLQTDWSQKSKIYKIKGVKSWVLYVINLRVCQVPTPLRVHFPQYPYTRELLFWTVWILQVISSDQIEFYKLSTSTNKFISLWYNTSNFLASKDLKKLFSLLIFFFLKAGFSSTQKNPSNSSLFDSKELLSSGIEAHPLVIRVDCVWDFFKILL